MAKMADIMVSPKKAEPSEPAPEQGNYVPPSRKGKKNLTIVVEPDMLRDLGICARQMDTTIKALGIEALRKCLFEHGFKQWA